MTLAGQRARLNGKMGASDGSGWSLYSVGEDAVGSNDGTRYEI